MTVYLVGLLYAKYSIGGTVRTKTKGKGIRCRD